MRKAIAIVAYDRSHYFSLVAGSILAQTIDGRPVEEEYDIFIFQDGLCEDDERSDAAGHARLAKLAQPLVEQDRRFLQAENLGVALHFDFIERKLFEQLDYDFVLFCEDDLVLAPGYVQVIDMMAQLFEGDPRVGMVSANPVDVTLSEEKQLASLHRYAPMAHNWAFGLSRAFWQKRQPMIDEYLDLVRPQGYRKRPTAAIGAWLVGKGFNPIASSQDFVKQCATLALGAVRVSTRFNLGLPIGRAGLHCRPEDFYRMGFGRTVVVPRIPADLAELEQEDFEAIFANQSGPMRNPPAALPHGKRASQAADQHQTAAAAVPAEGADKQSATAGRSKPETRTGAQDSGGQPAEKMVPEMEPEGLSHFTAKLKDARCLLEYGAGGSTVLAAENALETILSVEASAFYLDEAIACARDVGGPSRLIPHHVDIGPLGDWSRPLDESKAVNWPAYCSGIWRRIASESLPSPDLILIDGRFRVACFLASLAHTKPGASILFDDYFDRPHYHVAEKYVAPVHRAGRMAEFCVPEGLVVTDLLADLITYSTNCD